MFICGVQENVKEGTLDVNLKNLLERRICQALKCGLLGKEAEGVWLSSVGEALDIKGSCDIQMETFSRQMVLRS